jgi:hypothetical protein
VDKIRIIDKTNREETWLNLEILLRRFDITIEDVNEYYRKHGNDDEFAHAKDILSSRNDEYVQKSLSLRRILDNGEGDDVDMEKTYYSIYEHRRQSEKKYTQDEISGYVDKYKLFLLTALLYNRNFFKAANNWYKSIYAMAKAAKIHEVPLREDASSSKIYQAPSIAAAAGLNYEFEGKPVYIQDFDGNLNFFYEKSGKKLLLEIQFEFSPESSKENKGRIPFFLEVDIIPKNTENGQPETPVTIQLWHDFSDEKTIRIRSSPIAVNHEVGFKYTVKKIMPERGDSSGTESGVDIHE